jgi:hypothetical protein
MPGRRDNAKIAAGIGVIERNSCKNAANAHQLGYGSVRLAATRTQFFLIAAIQCAGARDVPLCGA